MSFLQLTYFGIDKQSALLEPVKQSKYTRPFFCGPSLQHVIVRKSDDEEVVTSEREEFAHLLNQDTNFKGTKSFLPGICLQMFGVSAEQWEDVQGFLRKEIFYASHMTMPKNLKAGEKLFALGPRTSDARAALKHVIIPNLIKRFPFLRPSDSFGDITFGNWCDRLWETMFATESRLLNERYEDIKSHLFARVDQISKLDWSHSDLGSVC